MLNLNMLQRDAVLTALLVVAAAAFALMYYITQYFKKEKIAQAFAKAAFVVSVLFFLYLAVFKRSAGAQRTVELRFLWSYRTYITGYSGVDVFAQAIENIAIFVPIGLFLPFWFKKEASPFKLVLLIFSVSLFAELCQLVFKLGVFELDDLFNNTVGGAVGVGLSCSLTAAKAQKGKNPPFSVTNARRFLLGLLPLFCCYELLVVVGVLKRIFVLC